MGGGSVGRGHSRSAGVPRQSQQDRTIAAIIIVVVLLQSLRNDIVHLLVVLELGSEGLLGGDLCAGTRAVCVVSGATENSKSTDPDSRVGAVRLGTSLRRVAAARLLAESLGGNGEARRAGSMCSDGGRGGAQKRIAGENGPGGGSHCVGGKSGVNRGDKKLWSGQRRGQR